MCPGWFQGTNAAALSFRAFAYWQSHVQPPEWRLPKGDMRRKHRSLWLWFALPNLIILVFPELTRSNLLNALASERSPFPPSKEAPSPAQTNGGKPQCAAITELLNGTEKRRIRQMQLARETRTTISAATSDVAQYEACALLQLCSRQLAMDDFESTSLIRFPSSTPQLDMVHPPPPKGNPSIRILFLLRAQRVYGRRLRAVPRFSSGAEIRHQFNDQRDQQLASNPATPVHGMVEDILPDANLCAALTRCGRVLYQMTVQPTQPHPRELL
ncbi:hypothetical protein BGZ57DRAFT_624737 [Hyaloscypha finlandica]|nr:hypothetical protein BGZ57DRAFT_624737 [Hyaloscypha finlandica]